VQAGTPVIYFTNGKRLTDITAAVLPSTAWLSGLRIILSEIIRIRIINAVASMKKAKMGLVIAPCRRGRDRSRASNILKKEAINTNISSGVILSEKIQTAAKKKNATPVMIDPEKGAAQLFSPRPRTASLSPHMEPSTITIPGWDLENGFVMIPLFVLYFFIYQIFYYTGFIFF
jgi:hypothetical protein